MSGLQRQWHGPHDPPGTMFRREQTRALYGDDAFDGQEESPPPIAISSFQAEAVKASPLVSPVSGQTNRTPTDISSNELAGLESTEDAFDGTVLKLVRPGQAALILDPVVVCVLVREGVDWLRDHRGQCGDELRPYLGELDKSIAALRKEWKPESKFSNLWKTLLAGESK